MKKKENLWQLLKRLDEEAAGFNTHLHEANRYFDFTRKQTKGILDKHEKDIHKIIVELKKNLKVILKKQAGKKKKG